MGLGPFPLESSRLDSVVCLCLCGGGGGGEGPSVQFHLWGNSFRTCHLDASKVCQDCPRGLGQRLPSVVGGAT